MRFKTGSSQGNLISQDKRDFSQSGKKKKMPCHSFVNQSVTQQKPASKSSESCDTPKSFLTDLFNKDEAQTNSNSTNKPKIIDIVKDETSHDDGEREKEPQTAQLIGNFIIRSLLAGTTGNYIAIRHKDLMAAAANVATSAMWFCEDFGSLAKRAYDIRKRTYQPEKKNPITVRFNEIKSPKDAEKCVDEHLSRFGQNIMTKGAFKEMLPFVAFDFVQGELYGSYQDSHPASSYDSSKDFLNQTKRLLLSSGLAGLITYPLQDSMDQIPGNIAHFIARLAIKPKSPTSSQSSEINHG